MLAGGSGSKLIGDSGSILSAFTVQIKGLVEKFADLVITVNKGKVDECIYLIELKYLTKTQASAKDHKYNLEKLISEASEQLLEYWSSFDLKGKNVKAYVMIFAGSDCIYCEMQ